MKKSIVFWLPGLFFLVFSTIRLGAQTKADTFGKIEKFLQDYQDFSALGRSGSPYIDEATISSFKNLFEMDANLFWDLFKTESQRINYLLTVEEYTDSVQRVYAGKKPVISYGKHHIAINASGKTAIAYLHKTNNVPGKKDSRDFKLNKTGLNLRLLFNIREDTILIQNITEDTRLTRIRNLSIEGCYNFVSKISGSLFENPVSAINPELTSGYTIGNQTGFNIGVNMDFRINRKTLDGLLINVGLLYSRTDATVNINNYVNSYRQSFDPDTNPFEISVFDRTPGIREKISLMGFSIPVTLKWYVLHRFYLKAGPQFSLFSGTSQVTYTLSHTGGGKCLLINENSLPANEQKWFYLDEQHEMADAQYGFFRNREFAGSSTISLTTLNVAAVFAIGIEARFKKIVIGIEPWLTLGLTNLTGTSGVEDYKLYPETVYSSFLQTFRSQKLNTVGLKLIIGKMFTR